MKTAAANSDGAAPTDAAGWVASYLRSRGGSAPVKAIVARAIEAGHSKPEIWRTFGELRLWSSKQGDLMIWSLTDGGSRRPAVR